MLAVGVDQEHGFRLVFEGRCDSRAQRRSLPLPFRDAHELHPRILRDAVEPRATRGAEPSSTIVRPPT